MTSRGNDVLEPFSCTECDYLARSVSDLAGNIWMEMKMRIMNGLATLTLRIRIYMVIDIKFRASGFITFLYLKHFSLRS